MPKSIWTTEYRLDITLNPEEFVATLEAEFLGGFVEFIPQDQEVMGGYRLFNINIPGERKNELVPFLEAYAQKHNAVHKEQPAMSYPFNPLI